ncbi:MAG: GAF domain-containing protein [Proteobacteria bacterium]|nr:GAF domain-containing protein [Pseudomonadota bacterium]
MGERTADYFRIFFEASQAVLSSRSLQDVLKLLVKRSVQALGVKAGSLRLVDEETNRLELVASHLLSRRYLNKGPLHLDRSIPEVLERRPVVIRDARTDPRVQYREEKSAEGLCSLLSVPVVARDRVIGVLRLYSAEPREFLPEEIEFVSALGEMGGLAIANARVYEEQGVQLSSLLQGLGVELPGEVTARKRRFRSFVGKPTAPAQRLEEFRALHAVTTAILASLDAAGATSLILEKVVGLTGVKGGSLLLVSEATGRLELAASQGLSDAYLGKGPLHADRSIQETLAGSPVFIRNVRTDPRVEYPEAAAREGIASILSIPIVARERVIGVLRLYSAEPRDYSQDDVAFLSALAEIAGIALMNARLYERTRYDLSFWQATVSYLGKGSEGETGGE